MFRKDKLPTDNVVDAYLSSASVIDFIQIATLGIGGFGRVELVRLPLWRLKFATL